MFSIWVELLILKDIIEIYKTEQLMSNSFFVALLIFAVIFSQGFALRIDHGNEAQHQLGGLFQSKTEANAQANFEAGFSQFLSAN